MMRNVSRYVAIMLGSLLLIGCMRLQIPSPIHIPSQDPKVPAETTVAIDIPKYPDGRHYAYYKFAKQRESQLDLAKMELSTLPFLLRMWSTWPYGSHQVGSLVEVVRDGDTWRGKFTYMKIFWDGNREKELIERSESRTISPVDGWGAFSAKFLELQVASLPTDDSLPRHREMMRGRRQTGVPIITFEFNNGALYRLFVYDDPREASKYYDEARKAYDFYDYCDRQFGLGDLFYQLKNSR